MGQKCTSVCFHALSSVFYIHASVLFAFASLYIVYCCCQVELLIKKALFLVVARLSC